MASTVIRGAQIKDSTVQRHDLDTSTVGQAVVTKIVQGAGITLSSTGADSGTGDVTVTAPTAWRGAWDPATAYVVNDQVIRYGSHYIATANNTNVDPSSIPGTTNVGNISQGASSGSFGGITAVKVTVSATGTLQSLSMFQSGTSGTAFNFGLYADNGSGAPGALIAQCVPSTSVVGLKTLNTTTQPTLTSGNYYVAVMNASGLFGYYDSSGAGFWDASQAYGTGSMPATGPTVNSGAFNFSLYLTMTIGATSWATMATGGKAGLSADSGNMASGGSDGLILVPQSQIWSVRLRSFQALSNSTFEVDQRNVAAALTNPANASFLQDRWILSKTGTMAGNWQSTFTGVNIPGLSPAFMITRAYLRLTLTTQQVSLGGTDNYGIYQFIEAPQWRELAADVTSLSLLVRSSVANLKFSAVLRDANSTVALAKLCTIPNANTWTLLPFPNIPAPTGGTFNYQPGQVGYILNITLACGATYIAPAADIWQSGGTFIAAPGASNFAAQAVNSTFDLAYISHEPGAQSSNPPTDCPFTKNLDDCLRYFDKSYDYAVKPGTATGNPVCEIASQGNADLAGWIPFHKRLAIRPTQIIIWNHSTGAANSSQARDGTNRTVSAINNYGEAGFAGFSLTTAPAAGMPQAFHYTADTGW